MRKIFIAVLRPIKGRRMSRKYLFKCKDCGHEFRLQAWKAICPNCEKSYSLVKIAEKPSRPRIRPRYIVTILLLIYASYSILNTGAITTLPIIYLYLYQAFIIGAAIFALSGSLPSNILSIIMGVLITFTHMSQSSTYYQYLFVMLGVLISFLGILDEILIRYKK